jgi:hypothetical protein
MKSIGPATPFRWLAEAFATCRAQPRVLFASASLLLVVALLPSLLQVVVETALASSDSALVAVQVLFTLLALVLFPPVVGGFYRLVHNVHEGRASSPFEIFAVFQDGAATIRLIATNLIFVLLSVALIGGLAYAFGGPALIDFLRMASTLKPGATDLPPLPSGLLPLMSVVLIVACAIMTAQGLATAAVAIAGMTPLAAVGAAFKVTLRNLGSLLLFYLPVTVIGFIVFMIFALIAVLIATLLSLVSPMLATLLVAPLTLMLILVMYALLFTFFYHAWRDTLGADFESQGDHQIAA